METVARVKPKKNETKEEKYVSEPILDNSLSPNIFNLSFVFIHYPDLLVIIDPSNLIKFSIWIMTMVLKRPQH